MYVAITMSDRRDGDGVGIVAVALTEDLDGYLRK